MQESQKVALIAEAGDAGDRDELQRLFIHPVAPGAGAGASINGVVIGKLVGFAESGATPLVIFPGQSRSAAQPARATLDLHAEHIGRNTVLMFEDGDPRRPIILGCLNGDTSALAPATAHVAADADGQRLVVSAKDQIVLRCGKASITLTKEGRVTIRART